MVFAKNGLGYGMCPIILCCLSKYKVHFNTSWHLPSTSFCHYIKSKRTTILIRLIWASTFWLVYVTVQSQMMKWYFSPMCLSLIPTRNCDWLLCMKLPVIYLPEGYHLRHLPLPAIFYIMNHQEWMWARYHKPASLCVVIALRMTWTCLSGALLIVICGDTQLKNTAIILIVLWTLT